MLHIRFRYIEPFSRNYDLKKKSKKFLTSNISDIYAQRTRPTTIKNLPLQRILEHLVNFTPVIVGHTKLIFSSKTNEQNEFKFLQIKAIIFCIITIFLKKIDRLVWEL